MDSEKVKYNIVETNHEHTDQSALVIHYKKITKKKKTNRKSIQCTVFRETINKYFRFCRAIMYSKN